MVPVSDFERMRQRFKQQATTNTLLEKVGDLGATEEAILESNLPASMAIPLTGPLERRRRALTKRLRTGGEVGSSYGINEDEPEPLVNTPSEALVKKLLTPLRKKVKTESPRLTPRPPSTPRPANARPSRLPKPSTSGLTAKQKEGLLKKHDKTPKSRGGLKKATIKGAKKGAPKALGFTTRDKSSDSSSDDDDDLSPRQTRATRRQQEQLHWRLQSEPKRRLGYDEERRKTRSKPQRPSSWEAYLDPKSKKKK